MSGKLGRTGKPANGQQSAQRVDKWLWHARFARTRTAAQQLVLSGKVRIDRRRVTSVSRPVKPGNVLTLVIGKTVRVIEVLGIAARRGSPEVARQLYEDRAPPITPTLPGGGETGSPATSAGRPDKHGRKQILALKRKQF